MKNVMCIVAVALTLVGSANFAIAQAFPEEVIVTGSEANAAANLHDGEYYIDLRRVLA